MEKEHLVTMKTFLKGVAVAMGIFIAVSAGPDIVRYVRISRM
jgi:hypothetical protein